MPFETANDHQVYYEVHGEGEVIFLLHHGFGCIRIWNKICPSFVTEGYRRVMFRPRGLWAIGTGGWFPGFYESNRYRPESVEESRILTEKLGIESDNNFTEGWYENSSLPDLFVELSHLECIPHSTPKDVTQRFQYTPLP